MSDQSNLPFLGEGGRNYNLWLELERMGLGVTPWTPAITLPGGWAASPSVRYRRIHGVTHFRGRLTTLGTSGTTILTLPEGFRPTRDSRFACSTGSGSYPAAVVVNTAGQVQPYYSAGTSISLNFSFPVLP